MIRRMQDKAAPDAITCPLIGVARDRWTRFQFPDQAHRCWARNPPKGIDLHFQGAICLGPDFHDCVMYRKWEKSGTAPGS
jgi:hypothetical protein